MKKCKVKFGIAIIAVILTMVGGCSQDNTDKTQETATETVVESVERYTEKEIIGMVDGMKDWYIVKDSKNIDLLDGVTAKTDIVKKIEINDSGVNLSKTGIYSVTYEITVNASSVIEEVEPEEETKAAQTMKESESTEEESEETKKAEETETASDENEELLVCVEQKVHVVTKEEGQKLADQGTEVLTSDNKLLEKSITKESKKDTKSEKESENKTEKVADNEKKSNDKNSNSTSSGASGSSGSSSGKDKPSTSSSGTNNSGNSGNANQNTAPSTPAAPAPSTPAPTTPQTEHTHNWVERTHTVHHDATGHYEEVVVQEAWDEPTYEMVERTYCSTCGMEIGGWAGQHLDETMHGGYWTTWEPVQTGSIHHDAVTESKWVEDSPAWDETVSDGYVCDGCGATK